MIDWSLIARALIGLSQPVWGGITPPFYYFDSSVSGDSLEAIVCVMSVCQCPFDFTELCSGIDDGKEGGKKSICFLPCFGYSLHISGTLGVWSIEDWGNKSGNRWRLAGEVISQQIHELNSQLINRGGVRRQAFISPTPLPPPSPSTPLKFIPFGFIII